jgi:four helix bundle protein
MSRDHRKLRVFQLADELVVQVYAKTATFATDERFGIRGQLRRAAVSVATNIVEGCARRTTREYLHLLNVATGSGAETSYLLDLSCRLGLLSAEVYRELGPKYSVLVKGLKRLVSSLEFEQRRQRDWPQAQSLKPKAE